MTDCASHFDRPLGEQYGLEYVGQTRAFSFAHILANVVELRPRSVLEVGIGTGIVAAALRCLGLKQA